MRWERFLRNCAFAMILFLLVDGLEATHLPGAAAVRAYIAYAVTTDWDFRPTLDRATAGAKGLVSYTERLGLRLRRQGTAPPAGQGLAPAAIQAKPPATASAEVRPVESAAVPKAAGEPEAPLSGRAGLRESDAGAVWAKTVPPFAGNARVAPAAPAGGAHPEPAPTRSTGGAHLTWPVQGPVTEPFGYRRHPISRLLGPHEGIDLAVASGTPVCAAAPGRVTAVFRGLTGGLTVELAHDGFTTRYLHLSSAKVKVGETVNAGALIALAGATGVATGPHLHFEVRMDGRPVDPLPLLPR
ncbi:MAG: M23 family metallopeptidase [Chitinophagales bacterium]